MIVMQRDCYARSAGWCAHELLMLRFDNIELLHVWQNLMERKISRMNLARGFRDSGQNASTMPNQQFGRLALFLLVPPGLEIGLRNFFCGARNWLKNELPDD